MAFRRAIARRTLRSSEGVWPINPLAGKRPEGWPGWPERKKFAFVLTHDVEGSKGLDNCHRLAEAEKSLGFRSSFNFIPEGSYNTPATIREALAMDGFEVGVHDWRHDGKLYRSHKDFQAAAKRINFYLREWRALGFRSGFMHHNLDWLHDLNISYDMSTFDTDPFEPQPDGVDTIFPFWVTPPSTSRAAGLGRKSGYVEMPYTLPQDSTLFLLLQHKDNGLWKHKLDWIAQKGGMALLNVHPDYINFENTRSSAEFPLGFYTDFLKHVRAMYGNEAWFALPYQMAAYVRDWKAHHSGSHGSSAVAVEAVSDVASAKAF
jgi:peptidoglycan/xylan/chitin deacetylase (PgdA/CDA1 family)